MSQIQFVGLSASDIKTYTKWEPLMIQAFIHLEENWQRQSVITPYSFNGVDINGSYQDQQVYALQQGLNSLSVEVGKINDKINEILGV
jgi:hypothetical protein